MQSKSRKEEKFKNRVKKVLDHEDLQQQRQLIQKLVAELDIPVEECAAALLYLSQPNLYQSVTKLEPKAENKDDFEIFSTAPKIRNVKYRLDVGSKHSLQAEMLKDLLVAESGVDRNRIGKIDIRHHYTIVELPDGMPADIFQVLADLEIDQQKFNIKRLKPQRKFRRFRNQD
jgi:DbpA-like RNA binding protein